MDLETSAQMALASLKNLELAHHGASDSRL